MFIALAVGVFFALLVYVRRKSRRSDGDVQRMQSEVADIQNQLEKAQHRNQQLIALLSELHEYKVSPIGRVSWTDLADFTVQTAAPLVGMQTVILLKWDGATGEFQGISARGLSPKQLADLKVRMGEGILGRAAQGGKVLVVNEAGSAASSAQEGFLAAPYLVLPLWVQSQVRGLFVCSRPQASRIGPEHMRLATLMAKQIQLTMENLELFENRQRVYAEVVDTLAAALGSKDPDSRRHSESSRVLVRAMSREMHLPELLTEQIEFGAVLHDLGKLGVDESILNKSGPLAEPDYAVVKKHPQIGHDILSRVSFFQGVAPIVLYHHEWVNGQGYPEGLAGEEIPLGSRMVAIVDAWDAMTHDQPYRKALPKTHAIAELRQQAGTQFDPKLVDIFLHVVDQLERSAAVLQPNA